MKFKKKITFLPAFDRTDPDPKKDYGVNGVEFIFFLIGERGIIQFRASTNWMLPHVQKSLDEKTMHDISCGAQYSDIALSCFYHPKGFDLGYHSPTPMYEGQSKMQSCKFFEDGCYYDGSSIQGDEMLKMLIENGSNGVWKAMKKYYFNMFQKPFEIKELT